MPDNYYSMKALAKARAVAVPDNQVGESPPEGYMFVYDKQAPFGRRISTVPKPSPYGEAIPESVFKYDTWANPNDVVLEVPEPQGGYGRVGGEEVILPGKIAKQVADQMRAYKELQKHEQKNPGKKFVVALDSLGKRYIKEWKWTK